MARRLVRDGAAPSRGSGTEGPKTVLFLRDHLIPSGGTIYFENVLPCLPRERITPHLAVLSDRDDRLRPLMDRGIAGTAVPGFGRDPRRVLRVLDAIRSTEADLLHLSGPKAMLLGRIAARLTGIPATVFFNNALDEPPGAVVLQRRLATSTAGGVAASEAMRRWAHQRYAIPLERIEVIHGGRDLAPFGAMVGEAAARARAQVRFELGIPGDAAVLGIVGRVNAAQKGHFGLISMFASDLVLPAAPHLVIVGDGPDVAECRRRADASGAGARIHMVGNRDDVPAILAALDVVAVPSLVEDAFPFAALEASAVGRPVVAFRSGGLPEAVRCGVTGHLAGTGDWHGLARHCELLLSDGEERERLGAAGRDHVRQFSLARHVAGLSDFLEAQALAGLAARRAARGTWFRRR